MDWCAGKLCIGIQNHHFRKRERTQVRSEDAHDSKSTAIDAELQSFSDRIMSARFRMAEGAVTIFQIYAPTADAEDGAVDAFYNDLQQGIKT